jgi:hypothetical protein
MVKQKVPNGMFSRRLFPLFSNKRKALLFPERFNPTSMVGKPMQYEYRTGTITDIQQDNPFKTYY